ncbi:hypothetical protein A9264_09425 [Vibrio sp. UCD-FRSSP16_10]|uniref:vWA domain-containing protein n=1 Tax=unclassified Vibrio TaxID=2614977 RepID=UPI0007FE26C6|nr:MULTISPECIES: VWA domain-containing protein [unclassified Vibrio]OBT16941.1 hypothetical protein A9260_09650 [Vibrio sp. UCD-FRSSP16_30]OBT21932.1 hypothetical protein A9264_09425 [Vibrio sp. UCD-FRSSP16_10]
MSNFEFLYPQAFLLLIPLLLVILWIKNTSAGSQVVASHLANAIKGEAKKTKASHNWLVLLSIVAVLALSGPSFEKQSIPASQSSQARVLVLDMSRSVYAQDIKPSRLDQIRYKAQDILSLFTQGQTGLVAYAGDAYTLSPLTTDAATLSNLVHNLSPDIMPIQGAQADLGVKQAITIMQQAGLNKGAILLFADDLDSQELAKIKDQLNQQQGQWTLSVLAFGTAAGAPIPMPDGSLLTMKNGKTVVAKTQFNHLRSAADINNGHFIKYRHDNQDIASLISSATFDGIAHSDKNQKIESKINNGFYLLPLLLLLVLPLFRKGVVFSAILGCLSLGLHPQQAQASVLDSAFSNTNQRGYQSFQSKDYATAAQTFDNAKWQAAAQYQNGDYASAIDTLKDHQDMDSIYNRANAYAQHGDLQQAIDDYQTVLEQQPDNADAQYNLNVVKQQQQQQQQDSADQSKQSQQQDKQNSDNKQQSNRDSQSQKSSSADQSQSEKQQNSRNNKQNNDSQSKPSKPPQDQSSAKSKDGSGDKQKQKPSQSSDSSSKQDKAQQQAAKSNSDQSNGSQSQAEKKDKADEAAQKAQMKPSSEKDKSSKPDQAKQVASSSPSASTQQKVDPDIRKLEQVESVRDPSYLLKAQMFLQANSKEVPASTGKEW